MLALRNNAMGRISPATTRKWPSTWTCDSRPEVHVLGGRVCLSPYPQGLLVIQKSLIIRALCPGLPAPFP